MGMSKAEKAARRLLRRHGPPVLPIDVKGIAQTEGLPVTFHDLEDRVSGMLVREEDSAVMAVNVNHHENRQRFTIAHELGHFLLHEETPTVFVDDLMVHFRSERTVKRFDPREAQANEFAACLLMPRELLKQDLVDNPVDVSDDAAVRRLARRYRVSAQALTIRLMSLGLVGEFGDFTGGTS